jgi:hypothetical protein
MNNMFLMFPKPYCKQCILMFRTSVGTLKKNFPGQKILSSLKVAYEWALVVIGLAILINVISNFLVKCFSDCNNNEYNG